MRCCPKKSSLNNKYGQFLIKKEKCSQIKPTALFFIWSPSQGMRHSELQHPHKVLERVEQKAVNSVGSDAVSLSAPALWKDRRQILQSLQLSKESRNQMEQQSQNKLIQLELVAETILPSVAFLPACGCPAHERRYLV